MARPPSEWPIPVYDLEIRERLIVTCNVPARIMLHHVPAPLTPLILHGRALLSAEYSAGRVLKRSGSSLALASEFHLLQLITPVVWQRACAAAERGLFTLRAATDHG